MSASATCGIRRLISSLADVTDPDCVHVWYSLWKTGGKEIVDARGLIVLRVVNVLV